MSTQPTSGALAGLTAVVTGASSGIGRETVRALARDGADVVLAARREERLHEIAAEVADAHGVAAEVVPTDVTDADAVAALVAAAEERLDGVDIVVANAGVAAGSDIETMTDEEYRRMMAVNTDGVFYLTRAALPALRESGGHLVYVGSFAGRFPRPYNPVYAATKWWVRGFAKSVSAQVGDDDIGVSIINPAAVRTEFEVDGRSMADRYAPGEVVEPAEVADAIAFAAKQSPSMVHELDLYERDKLTDL
ncbi:SDR family NAD(P)-dependent oxidoreductase [Haloglomus irregulare]|jgi:NADP-dependent 3-hydroxy acid dehydrogenase YdfG|uniref:SDR family NAD(P)-dependent oxidoreductase n=1 Tax=Haloglomus irregulare TaxID=2234134 RepID=A0A554NB38_9EURY|nr:SDR family oxidoreductase [Haloglomus irregulare]TSD14601.1 SDR family NAD(P)-dependent oxidoreductase [Haloglomus irregulare]